MEIRSAALLIAPALATLCLILVYGVDVPYLDDWGNPGGSLYSLHYHIVDYYEVFLEVSLESRNTFTRLVFVAVALLFGWHVKAIMLLNWLCVVLTFAAALGLVAGEDSAPTRSRRGVTFLLAALMFSAGQWANWLWSFQLMQFIPLLCLALSLRIHISRHRFGTKVVVSALLCLIATFSPPNGMFCWILAFPFLALGSGEGRSRARTITWSAVYLAMAAITIALYFTDFERKNAPPLSSILGDPMRAFQCLSAWIGAPFVGLYTIPATGEAIERSIVVGAVLLALTLGGLVLLLAHRGPAFRDTLRSAWPWLCFGAFSLGTGLATTVGRGAGGPGEMVPPRYYTNAMWVPIGLLGLMHAVWRSRHHRFRRATNATFAVAVLVLSAGALHSWIHGVYNMDAKRDRQRQDLMTLRLTQVAPRDPMWKRLTEMRGYDEIARFLMDKGYLDVDPLGPWILERVKRPDPGDGGQFRTVAVDEHHLRVEGWTTLPGTECAPDCVILVKAKTSEAEIVSALVTREAEDANSRRLGAPRTRHSLFSDVVATSFYEEHALSMFAVDIARRRAYRLHHDFAASKTVSYTFADHVEDAQITGKGPGKRPRLRYKVGDERRMVLPQPTDSSFFFPRIYLGPDASLEFGAALDERCWDRRGDGVRFTIEIVVAGEQETLFSQWIDPKNDPADRKWFDHRIDLGRFANKEVGIRLRTSGGPKHDTFEDWSGWSHAQITYPTRPYQLVSLSVPTPTVRIEDPLGKVHVPVRVGTRIRRGIDVGVPLGTRFRSSDPSIIEVDQRGMLIPHAHGDVDVIVTNGDLEARARVVSAWKLVLPFGEAVPGTGGIKPVLSTYGEPTRGNKDFQLRIRGVVGGSKGTLYVVRNIVTQPLNWRGLPRIHGNQIGLLADQIGIVVKGEKGVAGAGELTIPLPIPTIDELHGRVEFWQALFRDPEAVDGWSATNGLILTVK